MICSPIVTSCTGFINNTMKFAFYIATKCTMVGPVDWNVTRPIFCFFNVIIFAAEFLEVIAINLSVFIDIKFMLVANKFFCHFSTFVAWCFGSCNLLHFFCILFFIGNIVCLNFFRVFLLYFLRCFFLTLLWCIFCIHVLNLLGLIVVLLVGFFLNGDTVFLTIKFNDRLIGLTGFSNSLNKCWYAFFVYGSWYPVWTGNCLWRIYHLAIGIGDNLSDCWHIF